MAIVDKARCGSGNIVDAGAVLVGPMTIGDGNYLGPNQVFGAPPKDDAVGQDLQRDGLTAKSDGSLSIVHRNVFREFSTLHRGLTGGTTIGDALYVMAGYNVQHDCTVRDRVKLANDVQTAGYWWLGRGVYAGLSAVLHRFTVAGAFTSVGMGAVVTMAVVPPSHSFTAVPPD